VRKMLLCVLAISLNASSAFAQEHFHSSQPASGRVASSHIATAETHAANVLQQTGSSRDSLRNGALIGAIIGAAATFGFGMYLCHAIREEGDPPCLGPALVLTAAGAGAGALAGMGIDATFTRRPVVRLSLRF
jgi:hypothetical protein